MRPWTATSRRSKKVHGDTHDARPPTLTDLSTKYGHLLQHHGFQGRESATTVDEIKKTMKQDIVDINVIDARCKTLQHLEGRT